MSKFQRLLQFVVVMTLGTNAQATVYYSQTSSTSAVTTWWTETDGSGNNPTDFLTPGDTLYVQAGHTAVFTDSVVCHADLVVNGDFVLEDDLMLHGSLYGDGTFTGVDGFLYWVGTAAQEFRMAGRQQIDNMILDKSGVVNLYSDIQVRDHVEMINGHFIVDGVELEYPSWTTYNGSAASFMVTINGGDIRVEGISDDTLTVPMGPDVDTYRPLTLMGVAGSFIDDYMLSVTTDLVEFFGPQQIRNEEAFVGLGWTILGASGNGIITAEFPWEDQDAGAEVVASLTKMKGWNKPVADTEGNWAQVASTGKVNNGSDHVFKFKNEDGPFGQYIAGIEAPLLNPPIEILNLDISNNVAGGQLELDITTQYSKFTTIPPTYAALVGPIIPGNTDTIFLEVTADEDEHMIASTALPCDIVDQAYDLVVQIPDKPKIVWYDSVTIHNDLTVSLFGVDTICEDAGGTELTMYGEGGAPPYQYGWSMGTDTWNTAVAGITSAGDYLATLTDQHGCTDTLTHVVHAFPSSEQWFRGSARIGSDTIKSGEVELFKVSSGLWASLNTTDIPSTGIFEFDNLSDGDFILLVRPDTSDYPTAVATYYKKAAFWEGADFFTINCLSKFDVSLKVYEMPGLEPGGGQITGRIRDNAINKTTGDPIPGLDVVLVKIPPNGIVAQTTTDEDGQYQFDQLPYGDYQVHVDVPGANQLSKWEVSLFEGDTVYEKLDYELDSSGTIVATKFVEAGISSPDKGSTLLIYPNPSDQQLTVVSSSERALLQITNLMGQPVWSGWVNYGPQQLSVGQLPVGTYLVQLQDGKRPVSQLLVINR